MNKEAALDAIHKFQDRIQKAVQRGPTGDWETNWHIIENDLEAFIDSAFNEDSTDWDKIYRAIHPMVIIAGGNAWSGLAVEAKFLFQALQLVEHRLQQGQAVLKDEEPELVVEAGKPYSAYVKLRDIIETAKQSVTLVDPYVDRSLYQLLSNCPSSVHVRVLTRQAKMPGDFITEGSKFEKETGIKTEVRAGLDDLHDRLLIVDGRLFLSGASFKDLGGKASFIIEITDVKDQAIADVEARWKMGMVLL